MKPYRIIEYDELDSTNDEAKRLVRAALSDLKMIAGTSSDPAAALSSLYDSVVIARRQTAGRGRSGKSFASPGGDSIYASFILRPPERLAEQGNPRLTLFAAVAVCEAIEKTTSYKPGVKWVNDVLVDGKKVCGILTESIPNAIILGIGVNINLGENDLPVELQSIAGSLVMDEKTYTRFFDALAESVFLCTAFEKAEASTNGASADRADPVNKPVRVNTGTDTVLASDANHADMSVTTAATEAKADICRTATGLMDAYRARSVLIERRVIIQYGDEKRSAFAKGIADDGALIVEYEDGSTDELRTSKISVRLALNQA